MANYANLKAAIQAVIKTNGNEEITGAVMQSSLLSMINSLAEGYLFKGVATPSTNAGSPDQNVFYIGGAGTYANFGTSFVVPDGCVGVFKYNGSWTREAVQFAYGIAFDVSVSNAVAGTPAQYDSLSAALSAVPSSARHGGMTIRYIDSVSGQYMQYRLISTTWSTNIANWQGLDDVPDAGSNNLVKSGGVSGFINKIIGGGEIDIKYLSSLFCTISGYGINANTGQLAQRPDWKSSDYLPIKEGSLYFFGHQANSYGLAFYSDDNEDSYISGIVGTSYEIQASVPSGAKYVRFCCFLSEEDYVKAKVDVFSVKRLANDFEKYYAYLNNNVRAISGGGEIETIYSADDYCLNSDYGVSANDGELKSRSGWSASDYLPITGGKIIKFKCQSANSYGLAFYSNKNELSYISGIIGNGQTQTATVPANAKYIRFCTYINSGGIKSSVDCLIQVEAYPILIDSMPKLIYTNFDGKAIINSEKAILGLGASFMRGNSIGSGDNNVWLHLLGSKLGCNIINDALGGTNICYHANRLYNGDILGNRIAPVSDVDSVLIMHSHNKDVFTLPYEYINYSASDYENNGIVPFRITTGDTQDDVVYAKAFDYCIKKIISLYNSEKTEQIYVSSVQSYMGTYVPKPCQIVLCTHWHDARTKYNDSIRLLAHKWGLPLVRFDDKIGFTKETVNPSTGAQSSIEYVGNVGGASPLETIDGVVYGWHPMCGSNNVYIQRKMAAIAKDNFLIF